MLRAIPRSLLTLALVGRAAAYSSRPLEPVLTVHLVPHTHDDVGWLKTVDQYFSGSNNTIQRAGVRNILNSVVMSLERDPARTFTYVEQAFFQRWWRELSPERRALTRRLVAEGRLEFTNGGWCMHDEAAAHYVDMVDQTSLGHRFLSDEFGPLGVPTTTWQLDPFGHSATQAALLSAEAGMDGLFFGRIDYQDLALRRAERRAEWVWRASPSLGPDAQVFAVLTGSYGGNYGPPHGFDWDVQLNDEPVEDNPKLETFNLPSRVAEFVKAARQQGSETRGGHILWTMGSDFNYEAAEPWYTNMDKIIAGVNAAGTGVAATYSTPARYLAAKRADAPPGGWPLTDGSDLFPYADGPHMFWTGYFSSRPALKRQVRVASALLQATRQSAVLAPAVGGLGGREAAGVAQGGGEDASAGAAAPASSSSPRSVQSMEPVVSVPPFLQPKESMQGLGSPDDLDVLASLEVLEEALGVAQHHDGVSGTARQHVANDYSRRLALGTAAAAAAHAAALRRMGYPGEWSLCLRLNETVCLLTAPPPEMELGSRAGSKSGTGAKEGTGDESGTGAKEGKGGKDGTGSKGAGAVAGSAGDGLGGETRRASAGDVGGAAVPETVFRVSAWNAMGQPRTELVLLPISAAGATVRDESGAALQAQVHPADETVTSYARDTRETPRVLAFRAPLPPVGVAVFTVELHTGPGGAEAAEAAVVTVPAVTRPAPASKPVTAATPAATPSTTAPPSSPAAAASASQAAPAPSPGAAAAAPLPPRLAADVVLENELLRLTFSAATGRLAHMFNKDTGLEANVSQTFCFYTSHPGGGPGQTEGPGEGQPSGAYIFRPLPSRKGAPDCVPVAQGDVASITAVVTGKVVQEVRQSFFQAPGGPSGRGPPTVLHGRAGPRAGAACAQGAAGRGVSAGDPDTGGEGSPWLTQVVRLSAGERHATFEWTVGSIPKADPAFAASDPRQSCVAWRGTVGCDPHGPRDPSHDLPCQQQVPDAASGFCECGGGRIAALSGCDHAPVGSCAEACRFLTGKEIVSRFSAPSIASGGQLLTDANGRELLVRRRDQRPSWQGFNQTEPVAGNYYPVTTLAAIRDGSAQLTVLVDRAQGVGSISDGEIELMVHRRVLVDDNRGVAEPIDETETVAPYSPNTRRGGYKSGPGLVVRGTHALTLERPSTAAAIVRPLADRLYAAPVLAFAWGPGAPGGEAGGAALMSGGAVGSGAARGGVAAGGVPAVGAVGGVPATDHATSASGAVSLAPASLPAAAAPDSGGALATPLPPNVQLMTLAPRADGTVLLRLSHQFGLGEGGPLSAPVNVDLSTLFRPAALRIKHATEVSLTANQDKASILRRRERALAWPGAESAEPHPWRSAVFNYSVSPLVLLGPMEIKTFVLEV